MERPGAELIGYFLSPDRHPPGRQWSRKHAHTQGRLCERFVAPVIGHLACEDIKTRHLQAVVNAAPTAQEGKRLHALVSALVGAGITGVPAQRAAEGRALAGERAAVTAGASDRGPGVGAVRGPRGDPRAC
jgi:ribosomal protein L12E/L44/L45/RPP1/RPP2